MHFKSILNQSRAHIAYHVNVDFVVDIRKVFRLAKA